MGCNTSKESVQPVEGEEKGGDATTPEGNENEINSKPSSADTTLKATTPTTNSAKSEARLSNHIIENPVAAVDDAINNEPLVNGDAVTAEEEEAATKIQAVFRGHQTRRTMKQAGGASGNNQATEPEPTKEQLEAEFRADDVELCKAATTIQNSFRSHMKAKQDEGKDGGSSASGKQENKDEEEELDIDLTDPDLNKAATKIQASFRGHKVRKEVDGGAGDQ